MTGIPPLSPERRLAPEPLADLLARLGSLLLKYGVPTHRMEETLQLTATRHGLQGDVFAVPTGLWMSIGQPEGPPVVRLVRVHNRLVNLERLTALDEVFNQVANGDCAAAEAHRRLDAIESSPPLYPGWLAPIAGGVATGSASLFFGSPPVGGLVCTLLGMVLTALANALGQGARTRLLVDFAWGFVAGGAAGLAVWLMPELPRRPILMAGLIVVVPGMALTAGLGELAAKNLVSGTARLMEAAMVMVSLLFGVGSANAVERWIGLPESAAVAADNPDAMLLVGALAAGLAFGVIFAVPRRFLATAMLSTIIAWGSTRLASLWLADGPSASVIVAFVAALVTGLYANGLARLTDRPTQVFLLPGFILLVPGIFGFASLEQLTGGDVLIGASGFANTLLTAGALVTGLLVANGSLPARKVL